MDWNKEKKNQQSLSEYMWDAAQLSMTPVLRSWRCKEENKVHVPTCPEPRHRTKCRLSQQRENQNALSPFIFLFNLNLAVFFFWGNYSISCHVVRTASGFHARPIWLSLSFSLSSYQHYCLHVHFIEGILITSLHYLQPL